MRYLFFITCFSFIFFLSSICNAGGFPYRDKYSEVNIIELNDFKSGYDRGEFLIIDVRSKTEFDAIHIKNAINLPYANAKFTQKLRSISRKQSNKKIIVYCNGHDCIKSYKAAEDALYALIPNVYAYDAGIVAWAQSYPSETLLLGNELNNPMKQLISAETFIEKNLYFDDFKKKAASSKNAIVIDARDPIQRQQELPGIENDLDITLDKLVQNIICKGHMKDKELFIFDQVGMQVTWLMYYLVDNDYTDFYFLNGGATAVLKEQKYRVSIAH